MSSRCKIHSRMVVYRCPNDDIRLGSIYHIWPGINWRGEVHDFVWSVCEWRLPRSIQKLNSGKVLCCSLYWGGYLSNFWITLTSILVWLGICCAEQIRESLRNICNLVLCSDQLVFMFLLFLLTFTFNVFFQKTLIASRHVTTTQWRWAWGKLFRKNVQLIWKRHLKDRWDFAKPPVWPRARQYFYECEFRWHEILREMHWLRPLEPGAGW